MPELPEAEYMVRRLAEYAPGATIRRARILRATLAAPQNPRSIERHARGAISHYSRRAKNVLLHLETGRVIRIQLGMTGHVYWVPGSRELPAHTRAVLELTSGAALVFDDPRTFGSIHIHRASELPQVFAAYGPEPLDPGFTWKQLEMQSAGRRGPIKPFLLDQSRLAGLGNIWAAESLFHARIHPARPVTKIAAAEWRALHASIRRTLTKAIANTFKVTNAPHEFPDADLLWLSVYGRAGDPCRRCRTPITRTIQAARATYFCPRCQH